MRLLAPQILSSPIVDRYDIWVNTTNEADITFLNSLTNLPKVRLVQQPEGRVDGPASIGAFFRQAIEQDCIYIRFDDDIVWMDSDAIEKIATFRIKNPEYALVYPLIINNAICTNLLQNNHRVVLSKTVSATCFNKAGWRDSAIAEQLHRQFIAAVAHGTVDSFRIGPFPVANCRVSINCISWLGAQFAEFGGVVDEDEEEFLSVVMPQRLRKTSCINGDVIVSHFAFYPQRHDLDRTDILESYEKLILSDPRVDEGLKRTFLARGRGEGEASGSGMRRSRDWKGIRLPVPEVRVQWRSVSEIAELTRRWISAGEATVRKEKAP